MFFYLICLFSTRCCTSNIQKTHCKFQITVKSMVSIHVFIQSSSISSQLWVLALPRVAPPRPPDPSPWLGQSVVKAWPQQDGGGEGDLYTYIAWMKYIWILNNIMNVVPVVPAVVVVVVVVVVLLVVLLLVVLVVFLRIQQDCASLNYDFTSDNSSYLEYAGSRNIWIIVTKKRC